MLENLAFAKMWLTCKFNEFIEEERGDVNVVSIVVLIGVAVILAVVFKGAITDLINSLVDTIKNNATNAVGGN